MDYLLVAHNKKMSEPTFLLRAEDMKLFSRAIELAYLTRGKFEHMIWMLVGETGHRETYLVGYVQGAIDIYNDEAFLYPDPK